MKGNNALFTMSLYIHIYIYIYIYIYMENSSSIVVENTASDNVDEFCVAWPELKTYRVFVIYGALHSFPQNNP